MATDLPEYMPPSRRRIRIGQVYRDAYRDPGRVVRVTRIVEYSPGQADAHLEILTSGGHRAFRTSRVDATRLGSADFTPVLPTTTAPTRPVDDRSTWEQLLRATDIDPTAKLVGLMTATHTSPGLHVSVHLQDLARECRMAPRTVRRALDQLCRHGLLRQHTSARDLPAYELAAPTDLTRLPGVAADRHGTKLRASRRASPLTRASGDRTTV